MNKIIFDKENTKVPLTIFCKLSLTGIRKIRRSYLTHVNSKLTKINGV